MTHKTADQILAEDHGYEKFVRAMFQRSGDYSKDFAHAAIGMVTEIHELRNATDSVNAIEEAGDLWFYGVALGQVVGDYELSISGPGVSEEAMAKALGSLVIRPRCGPLGPVLRNMENTLLDHAKRWVGYGRIPEAGLIPVLADALYLTVMVYNECGMEAEPAHVELVNVKKLLKRYNGLTFSSEAAVTRDLPAERAVLEDAVAA